MLKNTQTHEKNCFKHESPSLGIFILLKWIDPINIQEFERLKTNLKNEIFYFNFIF